MPHSFCQYFENHTANRLGNLDGQTMVFFVMTVAAAEVAVGLAVILALFRNRQTVNADEIALLKW